MTEDGKGAAPPAGNIEIKNGDDKMIIVTPIIITLIVIIMVIVVITIINFMILSPVVKRPTDQT